MNHKPYQFIRNTLLALCLSALFTLSGCRKGAENTTLSTIPIYTPEYATGFTIDSIEGKRSRLITIRNPWQGADSISHRILLRINGEKVPEGFSGRIVEGHPRRLVAMSSTHIAMFDLLDESERIVGVSGLQYIANDHIRTNRKEIADVGYEGNINYELLASARPDLVILYGVSGASQMEGKLGELGIPFIYAGDYLEESPLGKAEWLVLMGELCGKRQMAEVLFHDIAASYRHIASEVARKSSDRPVVMLNTPYGDSWFMPSQGTYMVTLIEDAGGRYAFSENRSGRSVAIDTEKALRLASKASRWINVSDFGSSEEFLNSFPLFADTPPVTKGEVYSNTLRSTPDGGNDFFESGIVHPDLILRDIAKILHHDLFVDEQFVYYKKIL